jgi:hypothetical protein
MGFKTENEIPTIKKEMTLESAVERAYPPDRIVTAADYQSRIIQSLPKPHQQLRFRYWSKVASASAVLLSSCVLTVYLANALVVYEKEQLIYSLLKERSRLRSLLKDPQV